MTAGAGPAPSIRDSTRADLVEIQAIYAHHVLHGLASFEETPPTLEEMTARWRALSERGLPHMVAEVAGRVAGYAYAGPYRTRPAYRHSLENSVYVAPDMTRRGIGRALLELLIERCTALGYRQMIAIIGDSDNHASIELHLGLGFEPAGNLRSVGFKLGRWVDSVILQRALGPGDGTLP